VALHVRELLKSLDEIEDSNLSCFRLAMNALTAPVAGQIAFKKPSIKDDSPDVDRSDTRGAGTALNYLGF
jgi:hypothetical protein